VHPSLRFSLLCGILVELLHHWGCCEIAVASKTQSYSNFTTALSIVTLSGHKLNFVGRGALRQICLRPIFMGRFADWCYGFFFERRGVARRSKKNSYLDSATPNWVYDQ
jgi:hypothetical protein